MKKFGLIILILVLITGCGTSVDTSDPEVVLNSVMVEKYDSGRIIYSHREDPYYLSMIEDDSTVFLVILKNSNNQFEYLGGTEFDKTYDDFGVYQFKNDLDEVIVFGLNEQFQYETLSLDYINIAQETEEMLLTDDIRRKEYVLEIYRFPADYNLVRTSTTDINGGNAIIF